MRASHQIVFRAGGRDFTYADAVRAAEQRAAIDPARRDAREGLSCQRYAEDEEFELGPAEVESAADAYRTERDLTTVDDTERWLNSYDLSLDDFSGWLERRLWRQRFLHTLPIITRDYLPRPDEVEALLWPELVFGGVLPALVRELAGRVAIRLSTDGDATAPGWADDQPAMERLYLARCREVTSEPHIDRELTARHTSLLRLELQLASFDAPEPAREAWLCVTQDGEPLADVSRRAGGKIEAIRLFYDELPDSLRQPALSAVPGDIIPPFEIGDRVAVCQVSAKVPPAIDDPDVRHRIESVLIERTTEDLIQRHIRWT